MKKRFGILQDRTGRAVANASVTVYPNGSSTPATIFSDSGGAIALANPVTTNNDGEYTYYAPNGRYTETFSAIGLASETDSDIELLFDPADAGIISVKDYGAKGDGTTDDTVAIQAAINYLVGRSGGTLRFPQGRYLISSPLTVSYIESSSDSSGVRRLGSIRFVGSNSATNDSVFEDDTTLAAIVLSAAGTGGIFDLASTWGCSFEGFVFVNKSASATYITQIRSLASPVYSSTHTSFKRCFWRDKVGVTGAQFIVRDAKQVTLENCGFPTGVSTAVRIGENAGTNATLMDGDVSTLAFRNTYFAGDTYIRQCREVAWNSCDWFPRKGGSGEGSRIIPEGDQKARGLVFENCKAAFDGNDTLTWFTQGTAGSGLTVLGGEFGDFNRAFVLNGVGGVASFVGTRFRCTGASARDIEVQSGYAGRILDQSDHSTTINASRVALSDARTLPGGQFPVYLQSSGYTFASIGNYEDVISTSVRLRGGLYRVSYGVTIAAAASTGFKARLSVNGSVINNSMAERNITTGERGNLAFCSLLVISGTTAAVTVSLQVRQASGTASTVPTPSSVDGATYLILEEV